MTRTSIEQSNNNQLYWVGENCIDNDFPPVTSALRDPDGLLAIGGDLSPERLLNAYAKGIFPWYSDGQPIMWWSPDPRCVLEPENVRISRSLAKTMRNGQLAVTFNKVFKQVVESCARPRDSDSGTWITADMSEAYLSLHNIGKAVSVECWENSKLVGGLYGVVVGKIFFGESMFSQVKDASKVCLVQLCNFLHEQQFKLIDCQVHSKHLQSLGAIPMQRELFINIVQEYCKDVHDINYPEATLRP